MNAVSENFDLHEELALQTIDRARCTLRMADSWFADRIEGLIEEYCEEHNLNAEDYDAENVFWEGYCEEEDEVDDYPTLEDELEAESNRCETEYYNR